MVQGRARAEAMTGRIATTALAAGTPITAATFSTPGAGSAFAAAIRPGHRAISIAVGPAAGLAGFIAPGDRVDVLLTQAVGNRRIGQTLLVDIAVLGVDLRQRGESPLSTAIDAVAEAMDSAGAPDLVTIEVPPKQAEAIAVAGEMGKLSLVLRGPGAEAQPPRGRSWDTEVTGLPAALLPARRPRPRCRVRHCRG
jgi:pilus assembly protein CpaB